MNDLLFPLETEAGTQLRFPVPCTQMAVCEVGNEVSIFVLCYMVELWLLELVCLKHHGSLELIRQSIQFPFIFDVKMHPRLEQQWLELKKLTTE